jgi:hypothetical protein
MPDTKPCYIRFRFEVHPSGSVDGLRKIVTQDFRNRFGDVDFQIIMNKTQEHGAFQVYTGIAREII